MAEQTFKSPGFFEREIEIIARPTFRSSVTPVGIIGPAEKGPAFVPTTVESFQEYVRIFGNPDTDRDTGHAAAEFFNNGGKALTMCRVLGSGYNNSGANAGFEIHGRAGDGGAGIPSSKYSGAVQFIAAEHKVNDVEHITTGFLNDSDSITTDGDQDFTNNAGGDNVDANNDKVQLIRGMVFMHKDYIMYTAGSGEDTADTLTAAIANDISAANADGRFKLIIAKRDDQDNKVSEYLVSLDPDDDAYISKVLNTDSFKLEEKYHYLYSEFPVDKIVAEVASTSKIAILRGRDADGGQSISSKVNSYGDFKSRFTTPKTSMFISQPFGEREYDLFRFESLDDGAYASESYKMSISELTASTDPNYKYGTFKVELRDLYDTDFNPVVYESFSRVSLDPDADNYIARVIGDQKIRLNLDTDDNDEKRLVREGKYENNSKRIRVIVSEDVLRGEIPENSLPFGFRGVDMLKTTTTLTDGQLSGDDHTNLLTGVDDATNQLVAGNNGTDRLLYSVLPPLPYRMKVTTGDMRKNDGTYFQTYLGQVNNTSTPPESQNKESVNTNLYWGLNTSRITDIHNPNKTKRTDRNNLIKNLTKLLCADSSLVTSGEDSDKINNNKFSLSKVGLFKSLASDVTGSISDVFLEAVYVRNADLWKTGTSAIYNPSTGQLDMTQTVDPFTSEDQDADANNLRLSLAGLLKEDKSKFNKYNAMAKFTAPFYGGFDGVNIMDRDSFYFTDRSSSIETGAGHAIKYASGLFKTNDTSAMSGEELQNNSVSSYRNAIRVMTDEMVIDHNVLVIPGIRDALVTDFAARRVRDYGKAIYLMDIPHYDSDNTRVFLSSSGIASGIVDPESTAVKFDIREVNNNYVATYFPDVLTLDSGDELSAAQFNPRLVHVPSSVVALGALAKTDKSSAQWFAPAGFSRGSLSSVRGVDSRLSAGDRDVLYESRINPIASFPNKQFVIFGQKTTQVARTALDRVNVRRLMINIKRRIQKIAQTLLFSQNDAKTRQDFVTRTSNVLNSIKAGSGIEDFRVIMDSTNNTPEDVDNNRLNGRIIVVPTRAVEFIAMDFVITNSGVEFPS